MELVERKNCPMRHENGNCLPIGGFCSAVNDEICRGLHNAFNDGVNAEPIRHGKWIEGVDEYDGTEMCKCSECGYLNLKCEVFSLDGFRYCPNCGAKMNKSDNNEETDNDNNGTD